MAISYGDQGQRRAAIGEAPAGGRRSYRRRARPAPIDPIDITRPQQSLTTADLDLFGHLVSAIGTRDFGATFQRLSAGLFDSEQCSVLCFPIGQRPEAIVAEGQRGTSLKRVRRLTRDYLMGRYHEDISWQSAKRSSWQVHVISASDVHSDDYRHHFFDEPNITAELALIGHFDGIVYYASFYRSVGQSIFDQNDIDLLRIVSGMMIRTFHARKAWLDGQRVEAVAAVPPPDGPDQHPVLPGASTSAFLELRDILKNHGLRISPREAEICASIALGYSSHAIGSNLGIAVNTVLTHRKRAYAKLGISSQSELFAFYLAALRQV